MRGNSSPARPGRTALFVCLLALTTAAPAAVGSNGPPPPYTHGAVADSIITAAADHAYNLRFDQAESLMVKLVDIHPTHPLSHFFWALCYYGRYVSDFDDLASRDRYMELLSRSIEDGKRRLEESGDDPELYFYLGGAYGFRGMAYMIQSNWVRAYIDGTRGKNLLKKAVELRPDFNDARLGLGMFHYYVATLPNYLKVLARLLLIGGDREGGLAEIEGAAGDGYYAAAQARLTLIDLYADFEDRPREAMTLLREFRTDYPENGWLFVNKDQIHVHLAEYDSSLAIQAALIDSCLSGARYFKTKWVPHLRFRSGVCHFRKGDYDAAEEVFQGLVDARPENPDWVYPWAMVQLGMTLDITGRRPRAVELYREVRKMKSKEDSRKWAKVFLEIRCQKNDNRVYPNYFWNGAPLEGRYRP